MGAGKPIINKEALSSFEYVLYDIVASFIFTIYVKILHEFMSSEASPYTRA